jgi:hypothetical protein
MLSESFIENKFEECSLVVPNESRMISDFEDIA